MSVQGSDPVNSGLQNKRSDSMRSKDSPADQGDHRRQPPSIDDEPPMPKMGDAELGALHIRVIALENLVIALLADGTDRQLEMARNMARYIAPREGSTSHPLTTHAAVHMTHLTDRAARFGSGELPKSGDID